MVEDHLILITSLQVLYIITMSVNIETITTIGHCSFLVNLCQSRE